LYERERRNVVRAELRADAVDAMTSVHMQTSVTIAAKVILDLVIAQLSADAAGLFSPIFPGRFLLEKR
jgi:hypothetical protein